MGCLNPLPSLCKKNNIEWIYVAYFFIFSHTEKELANDQKIVKLDAQFGNVFEALSDLDRFAFYFVYGTTKTSNNHSKLIISSKCLLMHIFFIQISLLCRHISFLKYDKTLLMTSDTAQ